MKKKMFKFKQEEYFQPRNQKEKNLVKAFLKLKTEKDIANFLRDLLTLGEIEEFANRLEVARLLASGLSYKKIAEMVGVSTATVTRVAHWLFHGCGGYKKVLE
jgi:TrpR-related protein YerC/YecD